MKIVIVDDEQVILKWLKKTIEEISPEYQVAEACINGEQALRRCLAEPVDVLITDIRMPLMGGIELLRELNANQRLPYTVILSVYDDFSYVRDSFKLGAKDFLLKTEITKEGVAECLRLAMSRIEAGGRKPQEAMREDPMEILLRQYLERQDPVSRNALFQCWTGSWLNGKKFTILLLRFLIASENEEQIKEILHFVFQEEQLRFYAVPKSGPEWVLVAEVSDCSVCWLLSELNKAFSSFGIKARISAGTIEESCAAFDLVYRQAEETASYQEFYILPGALDYDSLSRKKKNVNEKSEIEGQEMQEMMKNHLWNQLGRRIEEVFHFIETERPSVPVVKKILLNILMELYWRYLNEENRKEFTLEALTQLEAYSDIEGLRKHFFHLSNRFISILEKQYNIYSNPVIEVLRYIERHYAEAVTLDGLAQAVHLNRSYISHIFKKETGKNIFEYLLQIRMEKAKELLLNTKDTIQQIGDSVGIADSAYFSRMFKKYTGATPAAFRKMREKKKTD